MRQQNIQYTTNCGICQVAASGGVEPPTPPFSGERSTVELTSENGGANLVSRLPLARWNGGW